MSGLSQTSKVYSRQRVLSSKFHCYQKCYKTASKLLFQSFWTWLKASGSDPLIFHSSSQCCNYVTSTSVMI